MQSKMFTCPRSLTALLGSRWLTSVACAAVLAGCSAATDGQSSRIDSRSSAEVASGLRFRGVNLSGAEWGSPTAQMNVGYVFPTTAEVDYYVGKGMNTIRLPFGWEHMQTSLFSDLDSSYLAAYDAVLNYATAKGAHVLVDPHNYARYNGQLIGSQVPSAALADLWTKLAAHFKGNDHVLFGVMNEPNTMSTEQWFSDANAAIAAIRGTGAKNLVLVPGNAWTGAASWTQSWYGTSNAVAAEAVTDPGNNWALEVHLYLDSDASGTHADCASSTVGADRIQALTDWLRQTGHKAFLGEFGGATNATCLQAMDGLLTHLDNNQDVYLGWTVWAGGPWWGNYMYTVEPANGSDQPQMAVLAKHLSAASVANSNSNSPMAVAPPPPSSPSLAPPPTASGGALAGSLAVRSDWGTGYCAQVTVSNGGAAVAGWAATIDPRGGTITQNWESTMSASGTSVTFGPAADNARIAPGGTATFGFCANASANGDKAVVASVE